MVLTINGPLSVQINRLHFHNSLWEAWVILAIVFDDERPSTFLRYFLHSSHFMWVSRKLKVFYWEWAAPLKGKTCSRNGRKLLWVDRRTPSLLNSRPPTARSPTLHLSLNTFRIFFLLSLFSEKLKNTFISHPSFV